MASMQKSLVLLISLLVACFVPFLFLGEESYITIHDNLDSEFIYLHLLKSSKNLFALSESSVSQIFNGLNTSFFHSEFSITRVIFAILPSFWAYILNSFLVRLIGVVGMYLLITDFYKDLQLSNFLLVLISLSFGLLPIYSLYGISVAGQPILLWSFLRLKSGYNIYTSLAVIALFPFYAHFAMVAPFILTSLGLYGVYLHLVKRELNLRYILGVIVLFISFLLANSYTISHFLTSEIVSHRSAWTNQIPELLPALKSLVKTMFIGHYHSSYVFGPPVILVSIYLVFKRVKLSNNISLIVFLIICIATLCSTYRYLTVPLENSLHILTTFNFNRFTFILPFLYYILLLTCLCTKFKSRYILISTTVLFCLGNIYINKEFTHNVTKFLHLKSDSESFASFYSSDVFSRVKERIDLPQESYRVVSLGFHPSIAQYNGFYTLDSYQNNYPLDYKINFRKVIEEELDKNSRLKSYYDTWGSRCYLFSSELRESCYLSCDKSDDESISQLNINVSHLKDMGCQYILSGVSILNASELNLNFIQFFESSTSALKIYLYKL